MITASAGHYNLEIPLLSAAPRAQRFDATLVIIVVLGLPVLLYALHVAPIARIAYPVSNLLLAAWLYVRRSPWYAGQCLLLFCFASLVRRLVDEQGGFDQTNPVLFTPYLCCLFAGLSFLEYWMRRQPYFIGAFLVIVFGALYGGALAALDGRAIAGGVDALKWIAGPMFAVYVLAQRDSQNGVRPVIENCLIGAATFMAIYGVLQFMSPSSWDAAWMRSVFELGMTSVGQPEPFNLRVFSTMNSPGSLGAVLLAGTVVALKKPLPIAVPAVTCMLVGLGLCQYRTIWAATALALLMLLVTRPGALRPSNVLAVFGVILTLSSTAFVPEIREAVAKRASSMFELKADYSGEERLAQYRDLAGNDALIGGEGLGLSGAVRRLDGLPRAIIDSGLIDILRALGVVVGTLFLVALITLITRTFASAPALAKDLDFDRALIVASFIQLPMGSVHTGELGYCAWVFLGLALAAIAHSTMAAKPVTA